MLLLAALRHGGLISTMAARVSVIRRRPTWLWLGLTIARVRGAGRRAAATRGALAMLTVGQRQVLRPPLAKPARIRTWYRLVTTLHTYGLAYFLDAVAGSPRCVVG